MVMTLILTSHGPHFWYVNYISYSEGVWMQFLPGMRWVKCCDEAGREPVREAEKS